MSWRYKHQADKSDIIITHDFQPSYLEINADEEMMERAVSNILSNAVRYAKHSITIRLRESDDTVTILIAHNGESISPDQINDIFERFYKGAKGQYGIGLAMAEDIITRHGGTLQVLSTYEETCFEIVLPNN